MAGTKKKFVPRGGGGTKRNRSNSASKKTNQSANIDVDVDVSGDGIKSSTDIPVVDDNTSTYPQKSLPLLRPHHQQDDDDEGRGHNAPEVGYVRATPPGHNLQQQSSDQHDSWNKVRSHPEKHGTYPKEGFDHILGANEIRQVDGIPIGGRMESIDGPYDQHRSVDNKKLGDTTTEGGRQGGGEEWLEPEEEEALAAELASRRATSTTYTHDGTGDSTPLDAPIGSLREKWKVLPHFVKLRGLMKQHIDSFDYFVSVEMKQIVQVSVCLYCIVV